MLQHMYASYTTIKMIQYIVPEAQVFKLFGEKNPSTKDIFVHPVSHIKSRVTFTIMTDDVMLPLYSMPVELVDHIKYI